MKVITHTVEAGMKHEIRKKGWAVGVPEQWSEIVIRSIEDVFAKQHPMRTDPFSLRALRSYQ